jgi:hypothetical protein
MRDEKTIELSTAGADASTVVQVEEEDTAEDVLNKAFDRMDEINPDTEQFQLRHGGGEVLESEADIHDAVRDGEVLHATTEPELA